MPAATAPSISVHPTAIVGPEAELGEGVVIGPWCMVTGRVKLGRGVNLVANVHLSGPVEIGEGTILYPFAAIGYPAQDFKFKIGDPTAGVTIGQGCIIRESVTVHAATKPDVPTRIGNRVFMMACSHVGHDGQIGNNVIMANSALVAGHGQVHDNVMMSGNTAIHQFCRIGRLAFLSGNTGTAFDIPPFCVMGARNTIQTINVVGMRRNGVPRESITAVRKAFWHVLRPNLPKQETIALLEERGRDCPEVMEMARFVKEAKRPVARGVVGAGEDEPA